MSSLCPNLEIYIRFVYSFTIPNASAFYFIEIIAIISWIGTQTQIRMGIGRVMFLARVPWGVKYVFLMPKSWNFICKHYSVIICSNPASYFLEMIMLISLVGNLTQLRIGAGCITFPGMVQDGWICISYVTIQIVYAISTVNYYFGLFSLLFSWNDYAY